MRRAKSAPSCTSTSRKEKHDKSRPRPSQTGHAAAEDSQHRKPSNLEHRTTEQQSFQLDRCTMWKILNITVLPSCIQVTCVRQPLLLPIKLKPNSVVTTVLLGTQRHSSQMHALGGPRAPHSESKHGSLYPDALSTAIDAATPLQRNAFACACTCMPNYQNYCGLHTICAPIRLSIHDDSMYHCF